MTTLYCDIYFLFTGKFAANMMYILLLYTLSNASQCWLPSVSQGNAPFKYCVQYYMRLISRAAALQEPPSMGVISCLTKSYQWDMLFWQPLLGWLSWHFINNSSPPGQNGHHFADDIFRCIFVNEKFCILIRISLKFVSKGLIDNNPALG